MFAVKHKTTCCQNQSLFPLRRRNVILYMLISGRSHFEVIVLLCYYEVVFVFYYWHEMVSLFIQDLPHHHTLRRNRHMLNVSVLSDTYTCCVTATAKVWSPVTLILDDSCQFDTCKYHLISINFRISITTHSPNSG